MDANGALQTVTDPKQLKAAAGCFGLLGVVTHISFELSPMKYALLKPEKIPISLAIPPLQLSDVPIALYKTWTEKDIKAAQADFERRATDDFYSEWFWYTYQSTAWVNTWNTTNDPKDVEEWPSPTGVLLQWISTWIGGWLPQTPFFRNIPGYWQAQLLAIAGMAVLPPMVFDLKPKTVKTYLPDGLHFFRGVSPDILTAITYMVRPLANNQYPIDSKYPSSRHGIRNPHSLPKLGPVQTRPLNRATRLVGRH